MKKEMLKGIAKVAEKAVKEACGSKSIFFYYEPEEHYDIIISNVYPTEEELQAIETINFNILQFKVELSDQITDIEREILFNHEHYVRGDMSEYMVRSTMSRLTYANESVVPSDTRDLLPGDIVIPNDLYGRYKGEVHIVTKAMKNDGNKNVVGRIVDSDIFNMRYLDSWKYFGFVE